MTRFLLPLLLLPLLTVSGHSLTPEQAVTASLTDADKQFAEDQPFLRYLYLPEEEEAALAEFTTALRFHVNLISRESAFAFPAVVAKGLWRVDVRDYRWDPRVFEKLADIDPYFHRQQVIVVEVEVEIEVEVDQAYGNYGLDGKWRTTEVRKEKQKKKVKKRERKVKTALYIPLGAGQLASLALLTQSNAPIVRADWFLVQGARQISLTNRETGTGYYDWLGGLKNKNDFFRLIGFHEDKAIRVESEIRAVVGESGVTAQNRQIVRQGAVTGPLWTTLETFDQSGAGVAINHLRRGEFRSEASEFFGVLPNGLLVTFLADADGNAQDSVPDKVAGNRTALNTSNDLRVHVNMACIQCHGGTGNILQPFTDDVRAVYTGRLLVLSNSKDVILELRRQYGVSIEQPLQRDKESYERAFQLVTGKNGKEASTLYSRAFTKYAYDRVDLKKAAREFGTTPEKLLADLKVANDRNGVSDFRLDPFFRERTLQRLTFEDSFQTGNDALFGVPNAEGIIKEKSP